MVGSRDSEAKAQREDAVGIAQSAAKDFEALATVLRSRLETTSAVDPQTRARINDALAAAERGKVLCEKLLSR